MEYRPGMRYLRSVLVFLALLIPSALLYRFGYVDPAEPLTLLNYQLILFFIPISVFVILLIISYLTRMRYRSESNDDLRADKRKDFIKYRKAFLEVGWIFRDYLSSILFGLTIPVFLIVFMLYLNPKSYRRERPSYKLWILGFLFYPIILFICYKAIETGLLYTILLFGPVSLLGLLKTWGDYSYIQITFPSLAQPLKSFKFEKIGERTFAETMYDEELDRDNVKGIVAIDTKSEHLLIFGAMTYYEAKSGKKPVTEIESASLDFYQVYRSKELDLSFILSKEKARPLIFDIVYAEKVSDAISRWSAISGLLYSVSIPKYEFVLLKIDDVIFPLKREYTHYLPAIFVTEGLKAKYGFVPG